MMPYDHARKDIIKALRFVEPVSSFRSAFTYQNAFHLVFEDIVARLAGTESWEAFLRAELLDPLGMSSSSYDAQSMDIGTSVALEPWSGDVFIANAELPAHGAGPIADGAFPDASTPRV
ncbi:CubicO group peptidase (beta-lactamase class C family) [Parapusillimonas granuli]|uniref:Serine hydrolase n=2 Tax=Parapusillimonas granuli TaxID=380911 RepID=A0A853FUI1_9BURK|nr:CubicO group peptidase (beta-lactamase class C family) [Parapusillimonas granuli]NYT49615.1 serine hydrolase [Parapusillimonas granuli]